MTTALVIPYTDAEVAAANRVIASTPSGFARWWASAELAQLEAAAQQRGRVLGGTFTPQQMVDANAAVVVAGRAYASRLLMGYALFGTLGVGSLVGLGVYLWRR